MDKNKQKKRPLWIILATTFAALLWAAIPFLQTSASSAETAVSGNNLTNSNITTYLGTALTGNPIDNVTPRGFAEYKVFSDNSRSFEATVFSVNLSSSTALNVFVNNQQVGQLTISVLKNGTLEFRTSRGQSVPTVAAGSVIEIRQGVTKILSGTFAPVPIPSQPMPMPSGTPIFTRALFAQLTGATLNNTVPRGFVEYLSTNGNNRLRIYVSGVSLPQGATLSVFIGDTQIGQFNLRSDGRGEFESSSSALPAITNGTVITIRNGGTTILSGTLNTSLPLSNSFPIPFPGGSPIPRPTLGPARFFGAVLRGNGVVPPVTTQARGVAKILLNEAGTEIQVFAGFFNLSSNQTTATINGPAQPNGNGAVIFNLGAIGGTSGFFPVRTFAVTPAQVALLRAGLWYIVIGSATNPAGEIRGQVHAHGRRGDFEGDGRTDLSVFRRTEGKWYFLNSSDNQFRTQILGGANDKIVSGDFDGDGVVDAAVFQNNNGSGVWSIRRSSDDVIVSEQWGASSDIPVAADFDGDDRNDLAVFRPGTGHWYIKRSSDNSFSAAQWGQVGDVPVAADFDGDGKDDIAVFRPSDGIWYQLRSSDNSFYAVQWGMSGDVPSVGDFDGDGRNDVTVWRPGNGVWYTLRSIDNQLSARQFGMQGDIPVAGEFDSDALTDIAVFRPSNGVWYQIRSSEGFRAVQFGMNGDLPAAVNQP